MAPREHCWHSTGFALLSDPPQYPQVCRFCGGSRIQRYHMRPSGNHGPYAPGFYAPGGAQSVYYVGGDGPCIEIEEVTP